MGSWKNFAVNDMPERSLYNDAPGVSLGVRSTSLTPFTLDNYGGPSMGGSAAMTGDGQATTSNAIAANSTGILGKPLSWWLVLVVLLVGIMFVAKKLGEGEQFGNLKLSIYNIIVIALAAMIGLGFFKAVFNRFQVPGLTTFINAI